MTFNPRVFILFIRIRSNFYIYDIYISYSIRFQAPRSFRHKKHLLEWLCSFRHINSSSKLIRCHFTLLHFIRTCHWIHKFWVEKLQSICCRKYGRAKRKERERANEQESNRQTTFQRGSESSRNPLNKFIKSYLNYFKYYIF